MLSNLTVRIEMKICLTCKVEKPLSSFQIRGGGRTGPQASCKECEIIRTRNYRHRTRRLLHRWKLSKGCKFCDFKVEHSCQLDIDHIDKNSKDKKSRGRAIDPSWSIARIKKHLSNCQVLCKNCHAIKTYESKDYLI